MTDWAGQARATIAEIDRGLAADLPLAERMKAIDAAYPFGMRAYSPYKSWLRARRTYLARFGYVSRGKEAAAAPLLEHLSPMERMAKATAEASK